MKTDNKPSTPATLPRVKALFERSEKLAAISMALTTLSFCFPGRELPEPNQMAYLETLADLTREQLTVAFTRAQLEQEKFFPTPGELRRLAGVETCDQCSERAATDGLQWVLWRIRRHGIEGRSRRGPEIRPAGRVNGEWQEAEYGPGTPCPSTPEPTRNALEELGAGDVQAGVQLLASHPLLTGEDDYPTLGLRLSAIEKLEARWLAAWRKANA